MIAEALCRAWESWAWHHRRSHPHRPWSQAELAEYMRATERYNTYVRGD